MFCYFESNSATCTLGGYDPKTGPGVGVGDSDRVILFGLESMRVGVPTGVFTSPAEASSKRIGYVWLSLDLTPREIAVVDTKAFDHLPVLVTLSG